MAPKILTDINFEKAVQKSELPVLVAFTADGCGYCYIVNLVLTDLAKAFADLIDVYEIDIDKNPESYRRYGIRNIPTVLFF